MEITKEALIDIIKQIDRNVERVLLQLKRKDNEIEELKLQNETLRKNNQATLEKIKDYIQELEQIRSHYANSNNSLK